MKELRLQASQPTFTCLKLTIETLEQRHQNDTNTHLCQSLFLNKVCRPQPETLLKKRLWHRCWRRCGVFIVDFEHISHLIADWRI